MDICRGRCSRAAQPALLRGRAPAVPAPCGGSGGARSVRDPRECGEGAQRSCGGARGRSGTATPRYRLRPIPPNRLTLPHPSTTDPPPVSPIPSSAGSDPFPRYRRPPAVQPPPGKHRAPLVAELFGVGAPTLGDIGLGAHLIWSHLIRQLDPSVC